MSIRVVCPICRHGFVIAERAGHRSIDCPACRNTFVFTAESERALTGQRPETVDDHERPRSPTRSVLLSPP